MNSDNNTELKLFMRFPEVYWDAWEFYVATHEMPTLPVASGEALDRLGELFTMTRNLGETDDDFRSRIRAEVG